MLSRGRGDASRDRAPRRCSGRANASGRRVQAAHVALLLPGPRRIGAQDDGIRPFEPATRFPLDLNAVPLVRELSHLPVIVDPSQATGKWTLVGPMSLAAVAAGANGLIIEVHPMPNQALSDGAQSLDFNAFDQLMADVRRLLGAMQKQLA